MSHYASSLLYYTPQDLVKSARRIIQLMLGCDAKTRQAIENNMHNVLSVINLVLGVDSDTSQGHGG
jgi:hypothetical protein